MFPISQSVLHITHIISDTEYESCLLTMPFTVFLLGPNILLSHPLPMFFPSRSTPSRTSWWRMWSYVSTAVLKLIFVLNGMSKSSSMERFSFYLNKFYNVTPHYFALVLTEVAAIVCWCEAVTSVIRLMWSLLHMFCKRLGNMVTMF